MQFKTMSLLCLALISTLSSSAMEITLGKADSPLSINEISAAGKWRGAAIHGGVSDQTGKLSKREVIFYLGCCESGLHLAVSSQISGVAESGRLDSTEFAVTAPNGASFSITIPGAGFKTDQQQLQYSTEVVKERRTHMLTIPWAVFEQKTFPDGQSWKIMLAHSFINPAETVKLVKDGRAEVIFDDNAPFFSYVFGKSGWQEGWKPQYQWTVVNPLKTPLEASVSANVVWIGQPEQINREVQIPAGESETFRLSVSGNPLEKRLCGMKLCYGAANLFSMAALSEGAGLDWINPNPPFLFRIGVYPSLKTVKARISCENPEKLKSYLSVAYRIVDGQGKMWSKQASVLGAYGFHSQWKIPDLPDGNYKLIADILLSDGGTASMEKEFEYKHFAWENNGIGLERVVIPPFQAADCEQTARAGHGDLDGIQVWK